MKPSDSLNDNPTARQLKEHRLAWCYRKEVMDQQYKEMDKRVAAQLFEPGLAVRHSIGSTFRTDPPRPSKSFQMKN